MERNAYHITQSHCHLPVSCRSLLDRYDSLGSCKQQIRCYYYYYHHHQDNLFESRYKVRELEPGFGPSFLFFFPGYKISEHTSSPGRTLYCEFQCDIFKLDKELQPENIGL